MTPLSPLTPLSTAASAGLPSSTTFGRFSPLPAEGITPAQWDSSRWDVSQSMSYEAYQSGLAGAAPPAVDTGVMAVGPSSPFARPRSSSNPFGQRLGQSSSGSVSASNSHLHQRGHSFGSASGGSSRLRHFQRLQEADHETDGDSEPPLARSRRAPVFVERASSSESMTAMTPHTSPVGVGRGEGASATRPAASTILTSPPTGASFTAADQPIVLSKARLDAATQHPRAAVVLGVPRRWLWPLHVARFCSTLPAAWWGFRCTLTFLGELILGIGRGSATALARGDMPSDAVLEGCGVALLASAQAERRFRVTEVFLAILWCSTSAYLSFFFTDCLMIRWLVNYTPFATLLRLFTMNVMIAYVSQLSMHLSGASQDPRMLLPAWVSIASVLTILYHLTQRNINIRKETHASIHVFSYASFATMCALLFQLHLSRENDPVVPLFEMAKQVWEWTKPYRIGA